MPDDKVENYSEIKPPKDLKEEIISDTEKTVVVADKSSSLSKSSRIKKILFPTNFFVSLTNRFIDQFIPSVLKTLADVSKDIVDDFFIGGRQSRRSSESDCRPVDYTDFYSRRRRYSDETWTVRPKQAVRLYIFPSERAAAHVLRRLNDRLDRFERGVSVADYYHELEMRDENGDMISVKTTPSDNNYGWTSFRRADVIRYEDGWIIDFPEPKLLD